MPSSGIPGVIGGPHVTQLPGEALGHNGEPKHVDAVALGEATKPGPGSLQTRRKAG